jgi:trypsin-like peptidase
MGSSGPPRNRSARVPLFAIAAAGSLCGCLEQGGAVDLISSPIVYGADDRKELFEAPPGIREAMAASMVALVPASSLRRTPSGTSVVVPSWGEAATLCADQRFRDQPAAALCSGVLVDWDLVLTAGHCLRVYPPGELLVVFGYYYTAADRLAIEPADVFEATEVTDVLDQNERRPRLDYSWLRLRRPARPPRAPVAIGDPAELRPGDAFLFMGAAGGTPIKFQTATMFDPGAPWFDYFIANTDSLGGTSGGGAFAESTRALIGVLARGGRDLDRTARGCQVERTIADGQPPEEELTYARRALEGLCAHDPAGSSLCRPDCGSPCMAQAHPPDSTGGCAVGRQPINPWSMGWLLLPLARAARRRHRSRGRPGPGPTMATHS